MDGKSDSIFDAGKSPRYPHGFWGEPMSVIESHYPDSWAVTGKPAFKELHERFEAAGLNRLDGKRKVTT